MQVFDSLSNLTVIGIVLFTLEWAIRLVALYVIPRNRKPSSAMAWLLAIFLLPEIGIILFLILGSPKLPAKRRESQKTLDAQIAHTLKQFKRNRDSENILSAKAPEAYQPVAKLSESLSHLPVFGGNKITVLPEYDEVIQQIIKDIDKAEHYVDIEYFIIALDDITTPLFDALGRATKRGVTVRALYDAVSTRRFTNKKKLLKRLQADGVEAVAMLPIKIGRGYVRPDLRNHRKLIVIDGHTGYTGSQNLIRRDYHRKDDIYYDEMVVRVQGPVVLQLAAVFLTDWYCETGTLLNYRGRSTVPQPITSYGSSLAQILPSGPGYEDENNLKLFTGLIHLAKKKITIVNPYFVPDDALTTAITSAARRGVEVTMINSEVMDQWMVGHAQRSFYEVLLKAGVTIQLYKAPILLHSKFITVDDEIATVGSSNLDIRSFELDLEVTMVIYDPKVVRVLNTAADKYLKRSNQLSLRTWQKRPKRTVMIDNIARLTSALQ